MNGTRLTGYLRSFDARVVLLSLGALAVVGLLRGTLGAFPILLSLSALVLFMAPGLLVANWSLRESFPGVALVPVAFAISTSIFALLGVPMLFWGRSLAEYLWVSGAVLAVFLIAAALNALRHPEEVAEEMSERRRPSRLWAPFLILASSLSLVSATRIPYPYEDLWVYLAYVREFMGSDRLATHEPYFGHATGMSRVKINGWLLEQAALSRVSGVDPIELVLRHMTPVLVVVALLAFYALALSLFRSERAALLSGCLYAVFFLVHLDHSLLTFGGEFVARVAEDKFAARFIFLPVALSLAVAFVRSRRWSSLLAFALLSWGVVAVHPVGLAIIGLSMAGFALLYLAVNWREAEAWVKVLGLGAAGGSLLAPVLYLLATGNSLVAVLKSADINAGDPDVLANMVFVRPERQRIFPLGEDLYMMHPALVLHPEILLAYLLGVPFLIWKLKRDVAAQLLLGALYLVTVVTYVPQVATFMGDHVVVPGQLWRLAWPIPLVAFLTFGWMAWELAQRLEPVLGNLRVPRSVASAVPLAMVVSLIAVAMPSSLAGARDVYRSGGIAQSAEYPFDPVFRWIQRNITTPSVVLAPDAANTVIPAYSAQANVVSLRGRLVLEVLPALERRAPGKIEVPQGALDVRTFFASPAWSEEKIGILRRYGVDYVMLQRSSPLNNRLRATSGFSVLDVPGEVYSMYAVNIRKLGAPDGKLPEPRVDGVRT